MSGHGINAYNYIQSLYEDKHTCTSRTKNVDHLLVVRVIITYLYISITICFAVIIYLVLKKKVGM